MRTEQTFVWNIFGNGLITKNMTCSLLQRGKIDRESRVTSLIPLSHFFVKSNPNPTLLSSLSRIPFFPQDFSESRSLPLGSSQIPYPVNKSHIFPHPALYFSQIPWGPENTLPNPVENKKPRKQNGRITGGPFELFEAS